MAQSSSPWSRIREILSPLLGDPPRPTETTLGTHSASLAQPPAGDVPAFKVDPTLGADAAHPNSTHEEPKMGSPDADSDQEKLLARDDVDADTQALSQVEVQPIVDEMRSLCVAGHYEEARAFCESRFRDRPELLDQFGHPIYFKDMLRISLALGDNDAAREFAEKLRPLLLAHDPCVDVLYARHFASKNANRSARAAWLTVLERSAGNPEALAWLSDHPEHAG